MSALAPRICFIIAIDNCLAEDSSYRPSSVEYFIYTVEKLQEKYHIMFNSAEIESTALSGSFHSQQYIINYIIIGDSWNPIAYTKFAYTVNFGLAPFFFSELLENVKKSPFFAISFDESLNDQIEKIQMDFIIKFWNESTKTVETRYFGSEFLKYSNAKALKQSFDKALNDLDVKKMVQISMDGPNVNWAMLRDLKLQRSV